MRRARRHSPVRALTRPPQPEAGAREPPSIFAKPVRRGGGARLPLTVAFLKKFIQYARHRPRKPELTPEAMEHIASEYADWRKRAFEDANATLPVTARTLETMIRLATAHAKMRLQNSVSKEDAEAALGVMRFALGAVEVTNRRAEKEKEEEEAQRRDAKAAKAAAAKAAAAAAAAAPRAEAEERAEEPAEEPAAAAAAPEGGELSEAARDAFNRALLELLRHADDCPVDAVVARCAALGAPIGRAAVLRLLQGMMDSNRIMLDDRRTTVYRV